MREQSNSLKVITAIAPAAYSADTTPVAIDRVGFGSVTPVARSRPAIGDDTPDEGGFGGLVD